MSEMPGIDPSVPPSGTGCTECDAAGGWWVHLRRCTQCGHIGCCDTSPAQHATAHAAATGHPVIRSFEPGEDWFWNYETKEAFEGPELAPPQHHPLDQPVPGPAARVPRDWRLHVHLGLPVSAWCDRGRERVYGGRLGGTRGARVPGAFRACLRRASCPPGRG